MIPGEFDPPMIDVEVTICRLLQALRSAQGKHQVQLPPSMPQFEAKREFLDDPDAAKLALDTYRNATVDHLLKHPPQIRDPVCLNDLWQYLADHPEQLSYFHVALIEPIRREPEDLYFDTFAVSQRRIVERRSPKGWLPRAYFVGIPTGARTFRCIVEEVTGRVFCTTEPKQFATVPAHDDFGLVRVMDQSEPTVSRSGQTVMPLYLPTAYGKWQTVVGPHGECKNEKIVGYGEE